jgi:inorganic pyrophosphatase
MESLSAPVDTLPPAPLVVPLADDTKAPIKRVDSSATLKRVLSSVKLEDNPVDGRLPQRRRSSGTLVTEEVGHADTLEYRIQHVELTDSEEKRVLSLWHDLPLYCTDEYGLRTGSLNFVCEIPRCSRKKYEIATDEPGNPIKQDEKKGQLRVFKKGDIFFNYGCFPRTWEDPDFVHPDVGVGGDNDPLDVCEIGIRIVPTAEVRQVKILGVLCLIDDGEADWKIIAIDETDRWAPELNDMDDVERLLPGVIGTIREWFRTYKVPDGKPENVFGLEERCMPKEYAMHVVAECHQAWKGLVTQQKPAKNLSVVNLKDLVMEADPSTDAPPQHQLDAYNAPAGDGDDEDGGIEF